MDIGPFVREVYIPLPQEKPFTQPQKIETEKPIRVDDWPGFVPVKEPAKVDARHTL